MPFDMYDNSQPDWATPSEWMEIRARDNHNRRFGCRYASYHTEKPSKWCDCGMDECKATADEKSADLALAVTPHHEGTP
jgi:hypothetical protein